MKNCGFFAHEFSFLHHLKAYICINLQTIIKKTEFGAKGYCSQTFILRRCILSFIRYSFFYYIYLMLFFQLWHILQRRLLQTPRPMLKGMCQLFNMACFYSTTTIATREPLNFENRWLLVMDGNYCKRYRVHCKKYSADKTERASTIPGQRQLWFFIVIL